MTTSQRDSSTRRLGRNDNEGGFTLIELILYIALISIFIGGAVQFAWDIIYGQAKSTTQQQVNHNLRLAAERVSFEIRNASNITSVTSSNLCLSTTDRGPLAIYLETNQLKIGWGNSCATPTNTYVLTGNRVSVTNLQFTDLSTTDTKNIKVSMTIENIGHRQEYQKTQTYTTTVELRSN